MTQSHAMNKAPAAIIAETTNTVARLKRSAESETNPVYRVNILASAANQQAWLDAHSTGLYVGSGAKGADGASVEFYKYCATEAEALAEVARFPKMVKVKNGTMSFPSGARVPFVCVRFNFGANGVTGEKNETSEKRLARFLSILGEYAWHDSYITNHMTRAEFEALENNLK